MQNYEDLIKDYIQKGLNIIPVKLDKRPAINSWVEFQTSKIDVNKFNELYQEARRKGIVVNGIAVITGKISGITVIDFDNGSKDILEGTETPTVKTGSGGKHYYFKYTDKLKQSANAELKIDVRNDGGYAVMPPSKSEKGNYEWVKDMQTPLLEVPQWVINHLNQKDGNSSTSTKKWDYKGVGEGGRNSRAVSVVGDLINKFKHKPDVAWELFQGWNLTNKPPLEITELENIFQWCFEKDKQNEQTSVVNSSKPLYQQTLEELTTIEQREMLSTGVADIDKDFLHPTGYYVILANPGVGKGFWALWLTKKFWLRHQKRTVYFSLEMTTDLIKKRILQQWSGLTEAEFNHIMDSKNFKQLQPAIDMLQADMFRVDEFGGSDTSQVKPEIFKKKFDYYYNLGFRIFHFDHLHEIEGAGTNETNQGITETWAKTFQGICKDYPDTWLFVFAQPKSSSVSKTFLDKTDIKGSKTITEKCEFFYSLNRKIEIDKENGLPRVVNDDRNVFVFLDKNRITSQQYKAFSFYFSLTANFLGKSEKGNLVGFFKE